MRDEKTLIRYLSGEPAPKGVPGGFGAVCPPYLEPVYDRISAARDLRHYLPDSPLALGALLRAAIVDNDEDVRKTAILVLVNSHAPVAEGLLIASAQDSDSGIRRLSLEGLDYLKASSKPTVADLLTADADPDVAALAARLLRGESVEYYELEAI